MGYRIHPLAAAIAVAFSSSVAWQNAAAQENKAPVLGDVVVSASKVQPVDPESTTLNDRALAPLRAATSDTASLLRDVPGVQLQSAGGTSSLPVLRGLADDRNRTLADGMDLIASCPNHMNSPLSYLDPSNVASLKVYPGISPVSVAGDSIRGTIIAEPRGLPFAAPGQGLLATAEIGGFYRSNGDAWGGNLSAALANESFSIMYTGSSAQADNYKAGCDFKTTTATGRAGHTLPLDEVGSTAYNAWSQQLAVGFKGDGNVVEAKYTFVKTPEQLYPNQCMDMLDNEQQRFNLRYLGQFAWGSLEARAYHERVDHNMDFGPDKKYWYMSGQPNYSGAPCNVSNPMCAAGMPMNTKSKTTGATAKADIVLNESDLLRVGGLYQHYTLDDWWPASGASMAPNTFDNINDGKRDRLALFGEWEARLTTRNGRPCSVPATSGSRVMPAMCRATRTLTPPGWGR